MKKMTINKPSSEIFISDFNPKSTLYYQGKSEQEDKHTERWRQVTDYWLIAHDSRTPLLLESQTTFPQVVPSVVGRWDMPSQIESLIKIKPHKLAHRSILCQHCLGCGSLFSDNSRFSQRDIKLAPLHFCTLFQEKKHARLLYIQINVQKTTFLLHYL